MDKIKLCIKEVGTEDFRICMNFLGKEFFVGSRIETKKEAISKALEMERYSEHFIYDRE